MTELQLQAALHWRGRMVDVRHFPSGRQATMNGQTLGVLRGAEGVLEVPVGASVQVRQGDDRWQGCGDRVHNGFMKLRLGEEARLEVGPLQFQFQLLPRPAAPTSPGPELDDIRFAKLAAMGVMSLIAAAVAIAITPTLDAPAETLFGPPAVVAKYIAPPIKPIQLERPQRAEAGSRTQNPQGRLGRPEQKQPEAAPSRNQGPIVRGDEREQNMLKVKQAGLLGAMAGMSQGVDTVFGGGLGQGVNNALGGLRAGAAMGDSNGVGGWASRGTGPGGGDGPGLGLGGVGAFGHGPGRNGPPGGNLRKKEEPVVSGPHHVQGGLSKELIAKVVRRHQNEIKFCYESELNRQPDLAGKVAAMFIIDPTGAVSEANVAESSLGNANVEACMIRSIRRWRFPEPAGGGVVVVTFPWVFKAAGEN